MKYQRFIVKNETSYEFDEVAIPNVCFLIFECSIRGNDERGPRENLKETIKI